MPPQIQSDDQFEEPLSKARKEIYYEGHYYDITDFIRRHPGGNVIDFYTEPGEDATQAIQQFHFRSFKRVEAILKTFKRRPAPPHDEFGLQNDKLTARHQALNKDFKQLFEDLKTEGYFEPCYTHVFLRLLEPFALAFILLGIFSEVHWWPLKFLLSALAGLTFTRFGYVMHEAGHKSLTGNPKIDHLIEVLIVCPTVGGSALWWNSQHNRHHAMPQRLQRDVDLHALPFVAFNERAVTSKSQFLSFFMKYQGFLYWTVDLFLAMVMHKFYITPRCMWRKRAYLELILSIPSNYAIFHAGLGWYFVAMYFYGFFFALNFALNHSHLEATDRPTHWIEYSLTHTANIESNILVDWWMGYLDFQIEHHLFPTMPNFRQGEIAPRVKALAEKHGLEYRVYGYWEAVELAMKNLYNVGKKVSSKSDFGSL